MRSRLLVPALVLVAAAGATALAQTNEVAVAEDRVVCLDCHRIAIQASPPLDTFIDIFLPATADAAPGEPLPYPVSFRNAWTAELRSVRITLDLAAAPSLGFASDVPELAQRIDDAIPVDLTAAANDQRRPITIDVPVGETEMAVTVTPADEDGLTGPDLQLLVYPPAYPVEGEPFATIDDAGRGAAESFLVTDRATFTELGYGNWTFVVQGRMLPGPDGSGGLGRPNAEGTVPFRLEATARATASADRMQSLLFTRTLAAGAGGSLPFRLVAVGTPSAGESIGILAEVESHFMHKPTTNGAVDDAYTFKQGPSPTVAAQGDRVVVAAAFQPDTTVRRPHNGPTLATASEAVGYATAFLLVSSVATGGMFGKASRRALNQLFGAAKRRVAFHNFLSYGILLAATTHAVLFIVEAAYGWTLGLIWGGLAVLALLGLGVTGAIQVPLIRSWGYAGWRWTHYGMAWAAIAFTLVHLLLDGVHFSDVQDAVGWRDPLAPDAPA